MSPKRQRSLSPLTPSTSDVHRSNVNHQIFRSAAIKDRSSVFLAFFSPGAPAKHLQTHPDVKTATHRIAAWRKPSTQWARISSTKPLFDVGHDDDGEQFAGKRLEKVLSEMNVEGSIVVARWYGGILLGPVRFTHIENSAREAIGKWKTSGEVGIEDQPPSAQRRKLEDDEKRTLALRKTLGERDQSIFALRGLLREKTEELSSARLAESSSFVREVDTKPTEVINYSAMPLQALERLEKARDATVSWILNKIEEVEQQQQQQQQKETVKECG